MRKKRLTILFWDLGIGGIQKRIRDIVINISDNNPEWETFILLRRDKKESFSKIIEKRKNVSIIVYPFEKSKIRPPLGFLIWIFYMYIKLNSNIVLTFLPPLTVVLTIIKFVAFPIRSKIIFNEGVYISTYLKFSHQLWFKPFIKSFYNFADKIIVPTKECYNDLVDNYSIKSKRLFIIPNWTLLSSKRIPKKKKYDFIYVGRFELEKNIYALIDIIKNIKLLDTKVTIIMMGSGKEMKNIKNEILKHNLKENVLLKDFDTNVAKYLQESKILLLPSFSEGMPNVVIEANTFGVPTIVNNFPGSNEIIINNKTGYITNTNEETIKFAKKLLKNNQLRQQMGGNAQDFVRIHFGPKTQKKFIHTLLEH